MTSSASINPRWFAPELLQQTAPASTHSDVWSFGMVCLEILSGHQPFNNISRDIVVMREIDNGKIPERPGRVVGLNDDVWALMRRCWTKKPEARPSIKEVKEKLLDIRRMPNSFGGNKFILSLFVTNINVLTGPRPIPKRRSIFSLHSRPSTGDSESSFRSSKSGQQLKIPFISGNEISEMDELSPISISTSKGYNGSSPRARGAPQQDGRPPLFNIEFTNADMPVTPMSPRSASRVTTAGPPKLEVPHLSVSSPSRYGSHFLNQRSFSSDHYPSTVRSVISTDSGIRMSGPIREAVTDSRSIVKFGTTGNVISGTLEGLVGRLINNFSECYPMQWRSTGLN
jgi:son of sevenless-like protein